MNGKRVVQSQYLASLAMLKQAVAKCPLEAWDNPKEKNRFWFVAYHTLRYAHLYLKAQQTGYPRWEARGYSKPGTPFSKEEILEKINLVERDILEQIPIMDLNGASGYNWILTNKLELQLDNIRHIQHHTGELYERLSKYNLRLIWASERHNAASPKEKK